MSDFQREERYIVVKLSDLRPFGGQEETLRDFLHKKAIPTRECVVVESDWPIYEETWENVQRLAEGRQTIVQERDEAVEVLRPKDGRMTNAQLHGCLVPGWECFHCRELFTTIGGAADHFGSTPDRKPACQIKLGDERGLVMALREAEDKRDELAHDLEAERHHRRAIQESEQALAAQIHRLKVLGSEYLSSKEYEGAACSILEESSATSLARIKAQAQLEALEYVLARCGWDISRRYLTRLVEVRHSELRRQAEESAE